MNFLNFFSLGGFTAPRTVRIVRTTTTDNPEVVVEMKGAVKHLVVSNVCPGGGIGRRAGFRYQWLNGRGSSSLLLGTKYFQVIDDQGSVTTV